MLKSRARKEQGRSHSPPPLLFLLQICLYKHSTFFRRSKEGKEEEEKESFARSCFQIVPVSPSRDSTLKVTIEVRVKQQAAGRLDDEDDAGKAAQAAAGHHRVRVQVGPLGALLGDAMR